MIVAAVLVPLFMLLYYRFCGVVADVALVLNMLILFAIMLALKVAFTLTGLVGLALTVGMAVDNNVLVFERLREEQDRGATLRMAIRNAFHRAGATIVDCNLTHLIAASVLYWLGNEQLRGFAIPLWIGVATSMYTSVFVAHVIFNVAEKRGWIARANMARWIGHTNIDFMGLAPYCIAGSIIITVLGAGLAGWRHWNGTLLDIDFTGGISVQAIFDEPQNVAVVRNLLEKDGHLKDVTVTDVKTPGETAVRQFIINTSTPEMETVRKTLVQVFGNKLAHNSVSFAEPKLIAAEPVPAPAAGQKPAGPAKESPAGPKKPGEAPKQNQSRSGLPRGPMLAMAQLGNDPHSRSTKTGTVPIFASAKMGLSPLETFPFEMLLAMADAPAKSAEKPATAEKAEKPAATEPAAKGKPAAAPAPAQPAEPSKTAPATPPPAPPATGTPSPEAEPPAATLAEHFIGGSESELTFKRPVQQLAVEQWLTSAIEAMKLDPKSFTWEVSKPAGVKGEGERTQWNLKTTLAPEKTNALLTTFRRTSPPGRSSPLRVSSVAPWPLTRRSWPSTPWSSVGPASSCISGSDSRAWRSDWRP